jgi:hypothetical protein
VVCSLTAVNANSASLRGQYSFVFSTFLALVISTFGTNMVRVAFNSAMASRRKNEWLIRVLTAIEAERVFTDMQAVQTADQMLHKLSDTTNPTIVDHAPVDMTQFQAEKSKQLAKPVMPTSQVSSNAKMCTQGDVSKEITLEEEVEDGVKAISRSETKPRHSRSTDLKIKDYKSYAT